jgi:hypothetical protein
MDDGQASLNGANIVRFNGLYTPTPFLVYGGYLPTMNESTMVVRVTRIIG